jgi:uncharacterized protein (DUF1800 family)
MNFTPEIAAMRWGYGMPLPSATATNRTSMLALLAAPDIAGSARALPQMAVLVNWLDALRLKKKPSKQDPALREEVKEIDAALNGAMYAGIVTTFARCIDSPDGFRERLVQFWADHFTTTTRSNYFPLFPLAQVEDAIRPNLTGRFGDLLRAAVLHPAMITYLDQDRSVGPNSPLGQRKGQGLNENLARELLELHTLGANSGFTQADVYQTAELLTGLSFAIKGGAGAFFDPLRVEPGLERVLGTEYTGEGLEPIHALLADLAVRPETARYIAGKLIVHFITDTPDPADIAVVERAFNDSGGDLMAVYRALLDLPSAAQLAPQKIRQPYDFMVASFRALGISGANLADLARKEQRRVLIEPLAAMGHPFKSALDPDGAPEEAASWITPQGVALRLNWALGQMRGRRAWLTPAQDPIGLARRALGDRATPTLLDAVAQVDDLAEATALILISPAFNRR